jgi:hypothetical protein
MSGMRWFLGIAAAGRLGALRGVMVVTARYLPVTHWHKSATVFFSLGLLDQKVMDWSHTALASMSWTSLPF